MFEDRRDAAEADEDGGGRDEEYEIKALRKTVGSGGFSIEKLVSARLIINREICTKGLWRR